MRSVIVRTVTFVLIIFPLLLLQCNTTQSKQENNITPDADNGGISLPEGFSALVVADNLGRGRHIDVNDNGDIYMALRSLNNGKGIVRGCKIVLQTLMHMH